MKFRRPKDKRDLLLAYIAVRGRQRRMQFSSRFPPTFPLAPSPPPAAKPSSLWVPVNKVMHIRSFARARVSRLRSQVVALIVEGYTLETTELTQELRLDALLLNKTFEMIGCNPIRKVGMVEGARGTAVVLLARSLTESVKPCWPGATHGRPRGRRARGGDG